MQLVSHSIFSEILATRHGHCNEQVEVVIVLLFPGAVMVPVPSNDGSLSSIKRGRLYRLITGTKRAINPVSDITDRVFGAEYYIDVN